MEQIKVWYFNSLNNEWIKQPTEHYKETKDEYKYFRVINQFEKHFYFSFEDYCKHNSKFINQEEITDVKGKNLFKK